MPLMARTASQTPDIPPALLARVARGERVIVRKGRKAVAALVSLADARALRQLESRTEGSKAARRLKPGQRIRSVHPTRSEVEAIREARREMQEKNTVPAERLFRELGL
jgi:antitoxin (DNA-binding transcriptional repressor) of toxin-antitoxin stability system